MTNPAEELKEVIRRSREEISKVIIGQEKVIDLCLVTVFSGQHALVEGMPGIAKTLLVRCLARVMDCPSDRIQFTPDLMPADITGTNVFDLRTSSFNLFKGPVFTTFLLADEINRAPAKTQSALLQAMQERKVTIDRVTHALDGHFTVFATENPLEHQGTYPLPEAQKDRFMMRIIMNPPAEEHERELARRTLGEESPQDLLESGRIGAVIRREDLAALKTAPRSVSVRDELVAYAVEIVRRTRVHEMLLQGASPRATQSLLLASRIMAVLENRDFVTPDDIRALAHPVLEHRLQLRPEYEIEGASESEAVERILREVPVPR